MQAVWELALPEELRGWGGPVWGTFCISWSHRRPFSSPWCSLLGLFHAQGIQLPSVWDEVCQPASRCGNSSLPTFTLLTQTDGRHGGSDRCGWFCRPKAPVPQFLLILYISSRWTVLGKDLKILTCVYTAPKVIKLIHGPCSARSHHLLFPR